jgi:hypothetical protein
MDGNDFLGVVVPIVLSILLTWLPSVAGDFIETQAKDMVARLKRSGLANSLGDETQQAAVNLAKGAGLSGAFIAMTATYCYGLLGSVPHSRHAAIWWAAALIWGLIALSYILHTLLTRKLYELPETYVRNPFSRARPLTKFTHYGAVTFVLTVSGLIVIAAACDALLLPVEPAAVPGPANSAAPAEQNATK